MLAGSQMVILTRLAAVLPTHTLQPSMQSHRYQQDGRDVES
jgi:hypothetical protein